MEFLKKFTSVEDANAQGGEGLYSPHVSIVSGKSAVNILKTGSKQFTCSFNSDGYAENITPILHNVGDIAYWDGNKVAFIPYTSWQSSLGTALAVCFIPTSHARLWGNGKARFLAVKGVDNNGMASEEEGSSAWDNLYRDAGLTKYTTVPTWVNTIGGSIGISHGIGYASSNLSTTGGTQNVIDPLSKYYASYNLIPSPYAADGSFYFDYIRTTEGNNPLSDFNGKANTATIVSTLGTDGGQAAKECSLYSTNGIPAGEWYLPSVGEWGYLLARFNIINNALTICNGVNLTKSYYWSSTEYGRFASLGECAYLIETKTGAIFANEKASSYRRPICALD